jgi:inosose dehydratase
MRISVACGQITWPPESSEDTVLSDISAAGYEGAPWGWYLGRGSGDRGRPVKEILATLERHQLRPAPGFLWGDFWQRDQRADLVREARQYAEVSSALGVTELYIAAGGFDLVMKSGRTRRQAAGHARPEDSLSDREFDQLVEGVNAVGRTTAEWGVDCCYHNHVGTVVETEEEIERLLSQADSKALSLGPDTGHLCWAGVDVVDFCRRHLPRIKTMHLKDIDAQVRDRGRDEGWDYKTFADNGVFTEVGTGCVEFRELLTLLVEGQFTGWVVVETDVTRLSSPFESARVSRDNLRQLGI